MLSVPLTEKSPCIHPYIRKLFMQDILGKMVTSVRRELLAPDDASRTIHECAALLGLQLSSDIPETTLMVSGMRQRALRRDLLEAFEQYGDIDDAAVSSNSRGFGTFFPSKVLPFSNS